MKIKVTQVKSSIKECSQKNLEALGLTGIGKEITHEATPNILGMIERVKHLVKITEV